MSRLSAALQAFMNPSSFVEKWGTSIFYNAKGFTFGKSDPKTLINDGFKSNTHLYSIINAIAETGADIPIIVEAKKPDGTIEVVTDGAFYDFVHSPNDEDSYNDYMYKALVFQLVNGNAIQYGQVPVGFANFRQTWVLYPQYMTADLTYELTGAKPKLYRYTFHGVEYKLDPEVILHLKKFNPAPDGSEGFMGMSPLSAAFRTMVADNEAVTANASMIHNKGGVGLLSNESDRALTPAELKVADDALHGRVGGGKNFNSVKTTSGKFKFIRLSMSPQDLQLLETNVINLRDLCSVFRVKSRMFNDPKGATFNNSKEDTKAFYTQGVIPPTELQLSKWVKFVTPGWNELDGVVYNVRLDTSAIESLQEDQVKKAEQARKRSEVIRAILTGIGKQWSKESAVRQLMDVLGVEKEYAEELIDTEIVINENSDPNQE